MVPIAERESITRRNVSDELIPNAGNRISIMPVRICQQILNSSFKL